MKALLIVESAFGNTAAIAEEVGAGLQAAGVEVAVVEAGSAGSLDRIDLLVVGAPTHNWGLPTAGSRAQAAQRGGHPAAVGVADWLDAAERLEGVRAVAFETAVAGAFSGSAAKKIASRLRRLGAEVVARERFVVAGTPPLLASGERERAFACGRSWGAA